MRNTTGEFFELKSEGSRKGSVDHFNLLNLAEDGNILEKMFGEL